MSTDLRIAAILIPIDDLSLLSMTLKEACKMHESDGREDITEDIGYEYKGMEWSRKCAHKLGRIIKKVDYLIELHHAPTLES